jgi:hypothetical protein
MLPSNTNPLPFQNVQGNRQAIMKRNIISWFVPMVGTIKMYINPQQMVFTSKKNIKSNRTKGGYTITYLGEELGGLSISGHTGTSGYEGINVLHEIYRAEQYLFDSNALAINAANNQNLTSQITNFVGSALGGASTDIANLIQTVSGTSNQNNLMQLNSRNISTLADVAFGIEMYYSGQVFRGYFDHFTITETTDFLIKYEMMFIITQKRGYRLNTLPFQKSPDGPTQYYPFGASYSYSPSDRFNPKE